LFFLASLLGATVYFTLINMRQVIDLFVRFFILWAEFQFRYLAGTIASEHLQMQCNDCDCRCEFASWFVWISSIRKWMSWLSCVASFLQWTLMRMHLRYVMCVST